MNDNEQKEINHLQKLIKDAVNFRKEQRDHEYINNEAHFEGLQWNLSNVGQESPFIVKSDINHLKNAVNIRLGSLYASTYYGKLKPLSAEDIDSVENLNVLYKNEWFRLKTDQIIEDVIRAGAIFDNGYVKLNYDPDKIIGGTNTRREGAITLERIETANVYLDPNANSIDDCDYLVEKISMTMDRIKREKPEWYKKLKAANVTGGTNKTADNGNIFTGRNYSLSQDNNIIIDAIYEKITEEKEIPIESETQPIENPEIIQTNEGVAIPVSVTEELTEKVRITRVKMTYMVGKTILEVNENYPFEDFPIIAFQWEAQPHSPYGIPLLRGLTIPQKVANLIESATNNIAIHYTVPTWLVSDDSGLDVDEVAQLINALGVVWKVSNIEGAIKQLDPPKLDADIITMGQTFVNYIKEYAGVTSAYTGDVGTAGSTSSGTSDAIARATIIDNEPLKQITAFVEKLTRLMVKFMTRYYKGQQFYFRNEEKDNKYSFNNFQIDDTYQDINYDFDVDLGSRSKNDKNRQYNLTKDIYQMQLQYKEPNPVINVTDVVKAAELDNYNDLKKRLDNMTEESLEEKATLIVQLMQIGQTITPNGNPLISVDELQEGIMDVLDDNNSLDTVEGIFNTYKEYQTAITDLKNNQYSNTVKQQMQLLNGQSQE
jgi:hypothetical protein